MTSQTLHCRILHGGAPIPIKALRVIDSMAQTTLYGESWDLHVNSSSDNFDLRLVLIVNDGRVFNAKSRKGIIAAMHNLARNVKLGRTS